MQTKKTALAMLRIIGTNVRLFCGKILHGSKLAYSPLTCLAFSDSVSLSNSASINFGKRLRTRGGCSFNVQESGRLVLGKDVFLNRGCLFNCHSSILVGDGCEFGPNVTIYDHDHVFRGGVLKDGKFKYGAVKIGKNCWIGAGTVILCGTVLGDNCVVGAGSVVKGEFPAGSLVLQKRQTDVRMA